MPRKCDVRDAGMALAYLVDCTLATVCDMSTKKSRPKHEYQRQQAIAQSGVDWLVQFGCDWHDTRVAEVIASGGSVAAWAASKEAGHG